VLFNSWEFVGLFLPVTLAVYWALRWHGLGTASIVWLGAASYLFYAIGETHYRPLILVSIAANLLAARAIASQDEPAARRRLLVAALVANLGALVWYKYLDWLAATLQPVLGTQPPGIALPVGISFFTFTQIAFLVDVYRRKAGDFNAARYFLFVTFFPHLIAGPILHHGEMMPQFARARLGRIGINLWTGLAIFALGLAKKVLLADSVASAASDIFTAAQAGRPMPFTIAWTGALAYTAQIYFDFSGYSDMALGLSRMFGIDLPINFNSPYKARSIVDFWRRWHITLSRFLRDYLYVALGGNRHGNARRYVNLFLTMLIGGIWHGAGWTFLAWGALHGGFLIVNHGWNRLRERASLPPLPGALAWLLTFVAVVFAWVPFRAPDFTTTWHLWMGMLDVASITWPPADEALLALAGRVPPALTLVALAIAVALPNSQQWLRRYRVGLDSPGYHARGPRIRWPRLEWRPLVPGAIAVGLLLGLALRAMSGYSEFIYFRF
jgi:D-alanyl-lipoteichoic acid acyltransferase DltB (MBOAT superfamily)